MTDLLVEVLDQNWIRKSVTGAIKSASITDELGEVGEASVTIPMDDPTAGSLPDPDVANPFEGRFQIYEDDEIKFSGVIDSRTIRISETNNDVTFEGKGRGILLGYYNLGRRDYLGWQIHDLFRELLRNNIAKDAVIDSISSEDEIFGGYLALSGDPFKANYWKSKTNTPPHTMVIDLGGQKAITAIRIMPQWWKDIDTQQFHWHNFTVETSTDKSTWTTVGVRDTSNGFSDKGILYSVAATVRYVRLTVTDSTDGYARIAQIMVYQDVADIGPETVYLTPFIENDDSGNCSHSSSGFSRPVVPGAFQGDDVITRSYVSRLESGGWIQHTFRGTSNAVYFTQGTDGAASAEIFLDGVSQGIINIPNESYAYKGFEAGDLALGQHTLKIVQVSGKVQVDYFNGLYLTSWRPIEDDDPSIEYNGTWEAVQLKDYFNFFSAKGKAGDEMAFPFKGDRVRVMGAKTSDGGNFTVKIDGVSQGTFSSVGTGQYKQTLFDWSGAYGQHTVRLHVDSGAFYHDRIEGNFAHTLYLRSRYEPNLKLLQRMSEILDSYLRFNTDGSVDLLGAVGTYGGTIIREGDNEGGTIINASAEHDYRETGSVCLALVNVNGELPIKAVSIDYDAIKEIGYKVVKLENSDAADQFLLNRQALQYLRDHRKPARSYDISFDPSESGAIVVGETTVLYAPSAKLNGDKFRVGKITTEYEAG